ncbi:hypothetical protein QWJ46_05560 [Rhizobium sp. CBN3]|uniref:hypothetical protein n=1 Tax=Rhizobium sp. CBN3 TaxID=3058045 RepID=UPI0026731BD4|nr:hypothetical protein [Rhizobium sp. CBN3]MDO3432144.1 hypothetical protein [Rhizobium sp. CBN3]
MIYNEDKPSGVAFPIIVILIAMVAIVGGLALSPGRQTSARVWVPVKSQAIDPTTSRSMLAQVNLGKSAGR